jgi:hypothetical protein
MDTNKDSMITRARKWIGCQIDDYCARRGRTVDAYDKGVDKTILGIEKMHAGDENKNNSGQLV